MSVQTKNKQSGGIRFTDIGARLRAYRIGENLQPEVLAKRLGISRAALYRAEKGEIRKIEMLTSIAEVLDVSLPNLIGAGVEYVSTGVAFFERMRQLEEDCEQIIGVFGPMSYLLTSNTYDEMLQEVFEESVSASEEDQAADAHAVEVLLEILKKRKETFRLRRPLIVSLIPSGNLEGFLLHGLVGKHDLDPEIVKERRLKARYEVEKIRELLLQQPIGVQLGIIREPVPATNFQIFRQADRSVLAISPFRLGERPNVRLGVALITSAPEALKLHEEIANRLWRESLKGPDAVAYLDVLIEKYGIQD